MFSFPFFRFSYPNYYYSYYNNYIKNNKQNSSEKKTENVKENKDENDETKYKNLEQKRSSKYNSFGPFSFINPFAENIHEDEPVIEILGLKLYLDDLIILGLLFLLYKEDVQDETLFLALLLLLLT